MHIFVVALVVVLIPASLFLFVNTAVSSQASQLITEQNSSALKLWSHVQYSRNAANASSQVPNPGSGDERNAVTQNRAYAVAAQPAQNVMARVTPEELFAEIVEFARKNHWLRETAIRLNTFVFSENLKVDEGPVNFSDEKTRKKGWPTSTFRRRSALWTTSTKRQSNRLSLTNTSGISHNLP